MTINEAIVHAREVAEENRKVCNLAWVWNNTDSIKKCAEEHEQLAEWLEELKAYREIGTIEELRGAVLKIQEVYNKAIDDFAEACKQNIMCHTFGLHPRNVDEIVEQLKAGDCD